MLFRYKGIDQKGQKVKSKLEANSLEEAKAKLKAKNILYTSLDEDIFDFGKITFKRTKKYPSIIRMPQKLGLHLSGNIPNLALHYW